MLLMTTIKEPVGLSRQDEKCSDGLSFIPLQSGKSLVSDAVVVGSLVPTVELVTCLAANRKLEKYSNLSSVYIASSLFG